MTKIKTFYDSRMNCRNNSYSPSSEKPGKAVADWLEHDLIEIAAFEPASLEDLRSSYGFCFVNAMLAGSQPTGFGLPSAAIAESTRWTVGSMMAAALHAVSEQTLTCSPSSGFHHAKYTEAANYCTFNGLVIAALKAIKEYRLSRVGILKHEWNLNTPLPSDFAGLPLVNSQKSWFMPYKNEVGSAYSPFIVLPHLKVGR